jgi:hypothetical protein
MYERVKELDPMIPPTRAALMARAAIASGLKGLRFFSFTAGAGAEYGELKLNCDSPERFHSDIKNLSSCHHYGQQDWKRNESFLNCF